jgi:hypothetical protein
MPDAAAETRVLRAKYLDWCSARLAERFLALSPDEIYELAERTSHGREESLVAFSTSAPAAVPAFDLQRFSTDTNAWKEPESFRVLVARVTEVLADTLDLPDFDAWAAAYHEEPGRYEDELLGLWREAT